jgi:hypothetical protein
MIRNLKDDRTTIKRMKEGEKWIKEDVGSAKKRNQGRGSR